MVADRAGYANSARLGDAFQSGGDIHPIAEDVAVIDDDVAEIDPDAEVDAALGRLGALGHRRLPLGRAAHRIDDAGELDQQPVAGGLDDAAVVRGDLGIDQLGAQSLEPRQRAFLVRPHQARIAGHIGGKDRGEAAGCGHVVSPIASRRPDRKSSRCSGFRR